MELSLRILNYVGESDVFMAVNTKNCFCDASLNERWRFINEKENRRNEIKKHAKIKTREKKFTAITYRSFVFCAICFAVIVVPFIENEDTGH